MAAPKKTKNFKSAKSVTRTTTPVRNSAIPPKLTAAPVPAPVKNVVTHDQIALRAYSIWQTTGGSDAENWLRAENELRTI